MKITLDRSALLRSLSHVQSVVERRNTIPILANVMLKAEGSTLTLCTTDMDLEMRESVPAKVEQAGVTTAPAVTLHEIIRKLPDGADVSLELDSAGVQLTVKAGRSKFKLSCLPVGDFPQLNSGDLSGGFTLPAADLRAIIDRTRFAMSTEETRYYLNGIYLHAADNGGVKVLRAVATDGHRLARFEMPLPAGAEDMPAIIIPRKTVGELRKLLDEAADKIEISLSSSKIRFALDQIVLTSKLIDGTFPDYQKVIPTKNDKIVEVNAKIFSSAIDRVSTIADGKSRAIKISLNGKSMTISAQSAEAGSGTEDIEINSDAPPLEIGFNARYLMDITAQVDGDGCRIILSDAASPTIIQNSGDDAALYVLMPLRV
ncbi:MAG: DNA polymerase III subunit beta [Pseudomonadota bacterium]